MVEFTMLNYVKLSDITEKPGVSQTSPPVQDENSCKFLLAAIFVYKPVINEYSKPVISNLQSG